MCYYKLVTWHYLWLEYGCLRLSYCENNVSTLTFQVTVHSETPEQHLNNKISSSLRSFLLLKVYIASKVS